MEPFWSLIVGIYGIFEGSWGSKSLLRGSWDLVTRVIIKEPHLGYLKPYLLSPMILQVRAIRGKGLGRRGLGLVGA